MALIVKTRDNKMLQDTVAGMHITPFRPHIVEQNNFVDSRLNKNDTRPQELEILVDADNTPEGITDKQFGETWDAHKKQGKISGKPIDYKADIKTVIAATKAQISAEEKAAAGSAKADKAAKTSDEGGEGGSTMTAGTTGKPAGK